MSINRVIISGNLTRDPDLRRTNGGTSVLGFGMAVNDRRQDANGNWEEYPNYVDCVLFGRRADSLADILRKGMRVAVEGRLRYSSWERDGQRRSKLEVVVDELELPPRGFQQQPQARQARQPQPAYAAPAPQPPAYAAPAQPPYPAPAPAPAYAPQPQPLQQQLAGMPQAQAQTPDTGVYDEDIPF